MEQPMCEICGEQEATCQALEAGLCDDCFADECTKAMQALMGKCCCSVWRQNNGYLAICLAPYGVEHDHN